MTATARGRFAPSPTGDLHLGGARTALGAWLAARASGGAFVLRVEDLDPPRVVAGAAERILDDLRWLGLDWDEGPDVGGDYASYTQSERSVHYDDALARLDAAGLLYPCWCSRADIARASQAPHGPGDEGPRYPGTCRTLTTDERADRARSGRRPSLRFHVPPGTVVAFDDAVAGAQQQDVAAAVGDFVVRRADGLYAYQLAVVVDDAAMRITDVVRGDDLLASTARQILLFRALGHPTPPRFAHLPLVLGPDGVRLAKRHGAIAVRAARDAGVPARQIVGRLAASLGLCAPGDLPSPPDLIAGFAFDRIPRSAFVLA